MAEKGMIPGGIQGILWGIARLGDDPWLAGLTAPGKQWEGRGLDVPVLVVCVINGESSSVYCQQPHNKPLMDVVAQHGLRVPEEVAKRLFAFEKLEWRP